MPDRNTADALKILARGWLALRRLDKHANAQGIPVLTPGACRACMDYAAALLRGKSHSEAVHLCCPEVRVWQAQIAEANEMADSLKELENF